MFPSGLGRFLLRIGQGTFLVAALLGVWWVNSSNTYTGTAAGEPTETPEVAAAPHTAPDEEISLPEFRLATPITGIPRLALLYTKIPNRPSMKVRTYKVKAGDTAWSIAKKYDLQPETILWGNEFMSADAGSLAIGDVLNILPVDGVLHTVQEAETLEQIASRHWVNVEAIVKFIGNGFDLLPPFEIAAGQQLVVPGGRNPVVWQEPGPPVVPGLGRKSPGLYSGQLVNIGTGYFIWPIAPPYVFTQDFWEGHPAIDLDTYPRQPIFASDSGTVIFSDWSTSGYGNLVIIDHGNGYWTYYAHNTANLVSVGQGVVQGQQIAESGSTGNSTGDHIDFRIRVDGGSFLNPMNFLP